MRMKLILTLTTVCTVSAGFIDRLNGLYARWNPSSNQGFFMSNDRQNYVTAEQLLPDALLHQQILGPQLAAAGYSGAQIVAGPIAVPLKNLPRPPGVASSSFPSRPAYQQRPTAQAPPFNQQSYPHSSSGSFPSHQQYASYRSQQKPSLRYQPLQPNQGGQQVLSIQQGAAYNYGQQQTYQAQSPAQFQTSAALPHSQAAYAKLPNAVPLAGTSFLINTPEYQQTSPVQLQSNFPTAYSLQKQSFQSQATPQDVNVYRGAPAQPAQQAEVSSYPSQQTSHSIPSYSYQQLPKAYPVAQQQHHEQPKQPVYQHVQKVKNINFNSDYYHSKHAPQSVASQNPVYHAGQVFNIEHPVRQYSPTEAPQKVQYSEWTPIPKGPVETQTSAPNASDNFAQTDGISDADLQDLNFNDVFSGLVPDIPEIPSNVDHAAFSSQSNGGQYSPSTLSQLNRNVADFSPESKRETNPNKVSKSKSEKVTERKRDIFILEKGDLPAQGRSSAGPMVSSQESVNPRLISKREKVKKLRSSSKTDPKIKRKKSTTTTPSPSSSAETSNSGDNIVTVAWKRDKPHAIPRIGEGAGRFVGKVLEDVDVVRGKPAGKINDDIFLSNVGYSIKFTSR
ncbi:AP2-associated protein kinase 1-like [Artemia franciscana]|uniref:Uncharacterized protein n=1 Tax=Artemia franciscana TaxID=6661 RepID=A0AA88HYW4_ARTSF|nr:hypothetical protein QYM36_011359 [Artemia franciscana]